MAADRLPRDDQWWDPETGRPTPLAIAAWVENPTGCPDGEAIAKHVESCEACRHEADLARAFFGKQGGLAPHAEPTDREVASVRDSARHEFHAPRRLRRRRIEWSIAGTAGIAAAALLFAFGFPLDRKSQPDLSRLDFGNEAVYRGAGLELQEPTLTASGFELAWNTINGASEYRVSLFDANGREVLRDTCNDVRFSVNEDTTSRAAARATLEAGEYSYFVEALRLDGTPFLKSTEAHFRFEPPNSNGMTP